MKLLASPYMAEQGQAGPALGRQAFGLVSSSPGTEEEDSGVSVDLALQFDLLTLSGADLLCAAGDQQHGERQVHCMQPHAPHHARTRLWCFGSRNAHGTMSALQMTGRAAAALAALLAAQAPPAACRLVSNVANISEALNLKFCMFLCRPDL